MRSSSTSRSARRARAWFALVLALVSLTASGAAMDPAATCRSTSATSGAASRGFRRARLRHRADTGRLSVVGHGEGPVRFDGVTFNFSTGYRRGRPRDGAGARDRRQRRLLGAHVGPVLLRYRDGEFRSEVSVLAVPVSLVTAMARGRDGRLLLSSMWSDKSSRPITWVAIARRSSRETWFAIRAPASSSSIPPRARAARPRSRPARRRPPSR